MSVLSGSMARLDGRLEDLSQYVGQVVLVVNTASQCGYTEQYAGLETLYQRYREQGFVVLGFPCNQFGKQEPGDNAQIGAFCQKNYGVSFPMFAKIDVNGEHAAPLYQQLKRAAPGVLGTQSIKWNFTKFLINRQGQVVRRFATVTKPEALAGAVEVLL